MFGRATWEGLKGRNGKMDIMISRKKLKSYTGKETATSNGLGKMGFSHVGESN